MPEVMLCHALQRLQKACSLYALVNKSISLQVMICMVLVMDTFSSVVMGTIPDVFICGEVRILRVTCLEVQS